MESELSKIKAGIKDPCVNVIVTQFPKYIREFIPEENRDIVMIYKLKEKVQKVDRLQKLYGQDISVSDITGQPLEDSILTLGETSLGISNTFLQICPAETSGEQDHMPLSPLEARTILSFCRMKVNPTLPIWVLTDASDNVKTLLLSVEDEEGNFIKRSWAEDRGFKCNMSLDEMFIKHINFSRKPSHMASCLVKSSYDLSEELAEDSNAIISSTALHASWAKLTLDPPLHHTSTEVKIHTRVKIGHGKTGLLFIWKQISLLSEYLDMLKNLSSDGACAVPVSKLPSSKDVLACLGREANISTLHSRIHQVLRERLEVVESDRNDKLENVIDHYSLRDKPEMDLTDRLWLIFIECSSYQELSSCINEIFIAFKQKNGPLPFINSSNLSRLGKALMKEGGIQDPLECLVEIGLEKLRKEMLLIFSKSQIATRFHLNLPTLPNFSEVSSADWLPFAKKWHSWLCQVHCAVELLCSIQGALTLHNRGTMSIGINVLKVLTAGDSPVQDYWTLVQNPWVEINTPVPIRSVERAIAISTPVSWRLTLYTSTDVQRFKSVFYRTTKNPFPFYSDLDDDQNDSTSNALRLFEFHSISEMICF